jgi:hypothetical protein
MLVGGFLPFVLNQHTKAKESLLALPLLDVLPAGRTDESWPSQLQ